MADDMMDARETAAALEVSLSRVRQLVGAKRLKGVWRKGQRFYRREEVERFKSEREGS